MRRDVRRQGAATADVVMVVAGVALLIAAAMPTLNARSFQTLVEDAAMDVETLRSASEEYFASTREWPTPMGPGGLPPEVATAFPGRTTLTRPEYSVQWRLLEMLETQETVAPAAPPPADADAVPDSVRGGHLQVPIGIGGVVVRSNSNELLAELLARYGARASFVRDSTWTLIVGATPGL